MSITFVLYFDSTHKIISLPRIFRSAKFCNILFPHRDIRNGISKLSSSLLSLMSKLVMKIIECRFN